MSAIDTTALAGTALAALESLLKDLEAKATAALPSVDLTLLQAFVTDLASQASGDPTAAAKLKADAKAGLVKAGHWIGEGFKALGEAFDPTSTAGTTATTTASPATSPAPASAATVKPTESVASAAGKTS